MRRIYKWIKKHYVIMLAIVLVLIAAAFIPLPYYIFQPGPADSLAPIITVSGGHKIDKGKLMLTSVLVTPVDNVYIWLYGKFAKNAEFYPKSEVSGSISNSNYNNLLQWMMDNSQADAVYAAMKYLKKPVHFSYQGVEIGAFTPQSEAKKYLKVGDIITAVNGKPVKQITQLQALLANQSVGKQVIVTVKQSGKRLQVPVKLINLNQGNSKIPPRAGIGFEPLQVKAPVAKDAVQFDTQGIGGPSAGLMFTLEIISQLYPTDLTHGYKIAGTGTISANGKIGQIGGIRHKIIAANHAKAQIFFVPKDMKKGDTNEKHAFAEAAAIHSHMKLVPVSTLAQAVSYLKSLHSPS